jgi:hypothetical protein
MRKLALLGLLTSVFLAPQFARAQVTPAKPPPAPAPAPSAAPPPATAPEAPPAPPGAYPQAPIAPPAQAAPPPVGYPYGYAPPQGYGYGQPVVDPARQQTLTELQQVDLKLASVRGEQKQYSLGGPAAMMGAGFGIALGFGTAAIIERIIAEDIEHRDCNYDNYYDDDYYYDDNWCDVSGNGIVTEHDEDLARGMARGFGVVAGIGAGVGIMGTVFLMQRLAKRREFSPQINELNLRRSQLLQQLRFGGGYSQNRLHLTISGRF